jgi:serine-type D-Ala-D-Ala carboxypeptidase (penicillin-binding protein 5/6)
MKKYLLSILILLIIDTGVIASIFYKRNLPFASPIANKSRIIGTNIWIPNLDLVVGVNKLNITAKSALFINSGSGRVIFSKNPHKRLAIASLVKVMTTLIALENKNINDLYVVSKRAADIEPDKMLLIAGERLTLEELLYGIFLVSANDAAEAISEGTVASRDEFINLMNDKAKLLGMQDTHFVNPTGLDEEGATSYSSAYDLIILSKYLIKNYPEVVTISQTEHKFIPKTNTHQDYDLYSGINLLTTYPGVVGFKTGFTPEAGLTLIFWAIII